MSVYLGACNTKPQPVTPGPDTTVSTPDSTTNAAPSPPPSAVPAETAPVEAGAEAQEGKVEEKTLWVREEQIDCEGEAPMKCLQVRDTPDGKWTLLYTRIHGFDFEPGFRYELKVRVQSGLAAPADGSSVRYTLLQVVKKAKP